MIAVQDKLSDLAVKNERIMLLAVRDWFVFATKQIEHDLTIKYAKSVTSELTDWDGINTRGIEQIKPATLKIMQSSGTATYKQLEIVGSFSVLNVDAVKAADKLCAELVTNVTNKTKAGVRAYVSAGIKEGKSMPKIARELRRSGIVGLTKPQTQSVINYRTLLGDKEKFPKLTATDIDRKVQRYTDKTHRRRMNDIARTETAHAQNVGYCQGLMENGVTEVELSAAPGACEECAALNGQKYPVEEGKDIIPVHPRCRCAMLPVIGETTMTEQGKYDRSELPATMPPCEMRKAAAKDCVPMGLPPWKKYNAMHPEQSSQQSLYDWYKLKYETHEKLSPSAIRFLRINAKRFEARSVKITKPISGVKTTTMTPAEVRALPKQPTVAAPKPAEIKIPVSIKEPNMVWDTAAFDPKAVNWQADYLKSIQEGKRTLNLNLLTKEQRMWYYEATAEHNAMLNASIPRFKHMSTWEKAATSAEKKAIGYYQESFENVGVIRKFQTGKSHYTTVSQKAMAEGKVHFTNLEKVMARCPNHEGMIRRGMRLTDDDIAKLVRGSEYKFDSFTSASGITQKKLQKFLDDFVTNIYDSNKKQVIFEMKSKTAAKLGNISKAKPLDEILIRKNTSYRITGVEQKKGFLQINMEEISTKIKSPGILPKSYVNEFKGWEARHAAHKTELQKRLGIDLKTLKAGTKEWNDVLPAFEKSLKSYTKSTHTFETSREHLKWNIDAPTTVKKNAAIRNVNKFYDKLEDIGADDLIVSYGRRDISANVFRGQYRAQAQPQNFHINVAASDRTKTYFHELGHLLEDNHHAKEKAHSWVAHRGGRKTMPYSKISSYSNDPQLAYKDKFIDPYVGKVYKEGGSEVLSMGMEQFTNYNQMMRFAKKDFDHFSFIHGILTGAI